MQIGPTQTVPWHYHTQAHDTFYVIDGTIRIFACEPEEEVCLTPGNTYVVRPGRPHRVANAAVASSGVMGTGLLPPSMKTRPRSFAAPAFRWKSQVAYAVVIEPPSECPPTTTCR